jgi:uncharacterized membrane protein (DUF4010 family)
LSQWQPYLIAIVIGLLVGTEREKSHPHQKTMGVRTFLLMSLLGAIAGGLAEIWLGLLLSIFALALIVVSYFTQTRSRSPQTDPGLTTEFAAGIIYCLGYMAHQSPAFSALMGPIVAVVLYSKDSLHRFIQALQPNELRSALLLLLGSVVVINLVPDKTIDPFGIFNPQKFGYIILILASIEFSGYALLKILGGKKSLLTVGFLGGLVSSTAVLMSSARQAKINPKSWRTFLSSAMAAQLAALIELLFIVGLISKPLLIPIIYRLGPSLIFGTLFFIFIARKAGDQDRIPFLKSPLDWRGVLRLSIFFASILAMISIAKLWLGDQGTLAISLLTGLFELHGMSLATATLFSQDKLNFDVALLSIGTATVASLFAKMAIAWFIERGIFAKALSAALLPMMALICLLLWIMS